MFVKFCYNLKHFEPVAKILDLLKEKEGDVPFTPLLHLVIPML